MKQSEINRIASELSFGQELHEHPALIEAQNTGNDEVVEAVAKALVAAEVVLKSAERELLSLADEGEISAEDLEAMAAIADEFDASGDPLLQKQASVLDFVLKNFGVGGQLSNAKLSAAQEAQRLSQKYRQESHELSYLKPREALEKDIKAADAVKAIKDQVKRYRPLEAPLSTRYCPDHPGVSVMRVGEYTYQCPTDKAIYNHLAGYQSMSGDTVPGGSVEGQTQGLGERNLEQMSFSTRESALEGMR